MNHFFFSATLIFIFFLLCISCKESTELEQVDPEALFVHEILPMFESKCMSCHGNDPAKIEGGLDLRKYEQLLVGGDSGEPAIVPGKPKKSILYQAIIRKDEHIAMPPKEGDKLSEADIEMVSHWIHKGAPWPDEEKRAVILADTSWNFGQRVKVGTSGGLSETWDKRPYLKEHLWAYYPVETYDVPWKSVNAHIEHPIDAFLAEKRLEEGIAATTKASKRILLRRASIDLIGLPPTPEEMEDFLANESSNAFEKEIERLLASPHYGEQWGRHWLDVVRYADSDGFSNDYKRPTAWRYRDYVIRSFNEDKPYNQFIMEQLAGDEMNPDDPELLIATGFLRMGPWEHTGMSVAAETRQIYLDDVTNIVGETFLATPLNCAKCHDHKYDPIPAKDYYRIQAVFATTQFAERPAPFLPSEHVRLDQSEKERIQDWIKGTGEEQEKLMEKEETAAKQWYKERNLPYLPKNLRRKLADDQQPPRYYGLSFEELGYRKLLKKRLQLLRREMERFEPLAYSVYNGPDRITHSARPIRMPEEISGDIPATFILTGGSIYAPLEEVEPGIMSVLAGLPNTNSEMITAVDIPEGIAQRRTAFAKWLTHPKHPIVARSMVNRIWQYHFGRGIVATPNNFGATGEKPTHPELLDWLATYFVAHNWSIKEMHRLIMNSAAYQLSTEHPNQQKVSRIDPENKWLSHFTPRRLEAEELKDAMLYISGELNPAMGGFPVRPEINLEVALQPRHTMGSIAPAYQPSRTPAERHRRSIYAERYRNMSDPYLEVFNHPGTDMSCEKREESTVTPQVFTLFNGQFPRQRAIAFAHKLTKEFSSQEDRIEEAIRWIWGRAASEEDFQQAKAYMEKMISYHQQHQAVETTYPSSVKREMFEEMTGESFSYEESLDIYQSYVPDLQAYEVDESTRALADLITVFFNANEFVYVY